MEEIFTTNGLPLPMDEPPASFKTTTQITPEKEENPKYNVQKMAGKSPLSVPEFNTIDQYLHVKQFYTGMLRSNQRKQVLVEETERIKAILEGGDPEAIKELMRERHTWRTAIQNNRSNGLMICKNEDCSHIAIPSSEYCINHILSDPTQVLFAECPKCHMPYPKHGKCLKCNP